MSDADRSVTAHLLTPLHAGAIAVLRITGPDATARVAPLLRPLATGRRLTGLAAGQLMHAELIDPATTEPGPAEIIDDVVVSWLPANAAGAAGPDAPADATCVDLCVHGGLRVVERVFDALGRQGVAVASPGSEASRSTAAAWPADSFLEREALDALITARTELAVTFLAHQRRALPRLVRQLADSLAVPAEADWAAAIDALRSIGARAPAARRLVEGTSIALVGPPNSGKSTLFNRLVGRTAATVSPQPGTTRDYVEASLELAGFPVQLVDTAGLSPAAGPADAPDALAQQQGRDRARRADIVVTLVDGAAAAPSGSPPDTAPAPPSILALNKQDLGLHTDWRACAGEAICLSARTGDGVDGLLARLTAWLAPADFDPRLPAWFTARQQQAADRVLATLADHAADAPNRLRRDILAGVTPHFCR